MCFLRIKRRQYVMLFEAAAQSVPVCCWNTFGRYSSRFEQCSFLNMTSAHAITQIPSLFSFIGLSGGITCYQTRFTLYCIQDPHNVPLTTPNFKFQKYVWINDLPDLFLRPKDVTVVGSESVNIFLPKNGWWLGEGRGWRKIPSRNYSRAVPCL